jgi:hypothetical protein
MSMVSPSSKPQERIILTILGPVHGKSVGADILSVPTVEPGSRSGSVESDPQTCLPPCIDWW